MFENYPLGFRGTALPNLTPLQVEEERQRIRLQTIQSFKDKKIAEGYTLSGNTLSKTEGDKTIIITIDNEGNVTQRIVMTPKPSLDSGQVSPLTQEINKYEKLLKRIREGKVDATPQARKNIERQLEQLRETQRNVLSGKGAFYTSAKTVETPVNIAPPASDVVERITSKVSSYDKYYKPALEQEAVRQKLQSTVEQKDFFVGKLTAPKKTVGEESALPSSTVALIDFTGEQEKQKSEALKTVKQAQYEYLNAPSPQERFKASIKEIGAGGTLFTYGLVESPTSASEVIVHPYKSLQSAVYTVEHPVLSAQRFGAYVLENPYYVAGQITGQVLISKAIGSAFVQAKPFFRQFAPPPVSGEEIRLGTAQTLGLKSLTPAERSYLSKYDIGYEFNPIASPLDVGAQSTLTNRFISEQRLKGIVREGETLRYEEFGKPTPVYDEGGRLIGYSSVEKSQIKLIENPSYTGVDVEKIVTESGKVYYVPRSYQGLSVVTFKTPSGEIISLPTRQITGQTTLTSKLAPELRSVVDAQNYGLPVVQPTSEGRLVYEFGSVATKQTELSQFGVGLPKIVPPVRPTAPLVFSKSLPAEPSFAVGSTGELFLRESYRIPVRETLGLTGQASVLQQPIQTTANIGVSTATRIPATVQVFEPLTQNIPLTSPIVATSQGTGFIPLFNLLPKTEVRIQQLPIQIPVQVPLTKPAVVPQTVPKVETKLELLPQVVPKLATVQETSQVQSFKIPFEYPVRTESRRTVQEAVKPVETATIPVVPFGGISPNPKVYRALLRRRKKFIEVGRFGTKEEAVRKAYQSAETTAGVSIKVENIRTGQSERIGNIKPEFAPSRKETNVLLQIPKKRISSAGEKQEITYKGLAKLKLKKGFKVRL